MTIYLGKTGLNKSWQKEFSKETICKCGGKARIMFVAYEGREEKYICSLHQNEGKGNYWVHDSISVAVYLCKDCFETTSILNQA